MKIKVKDLKEVISLSQNNYEKDVIMETINSNGNNERINSEESYVKEINRRNIRNHKRKLHSSLNQFKCQTCQRNFESEKTLNIHNEMEHVNIPEQDVEFNCTGCSFQTTEQKHLRKHIELVHTLKRNFNCSRCDYIGITSAELSKHIGEIHEANDCKGKTSNLKGFSQSDLRTHTVREHGSVDIIRCRICGDAFMSKGRLMEHRKKEHIKTVAYCKNKIDGTCIYSDLKCWWNHDNQSDTERSGLTFKCFICSETFSEKGQMMTHKKKEHLESVRYCNLILDGKCPFLDEKCWYRHTENAKNNSEEVINEDEQKETSVFQEVQEDLAPPIVQN